MAKTMEHDVQILQEMISIQKATSKIITEKESEDLVYFNIIKLIKLKKNISTKTKKETLSLIFDDYFDKIIEENLTSCFPMVSKESIIEYAKELVSGKSQNLLQERHEECVEVANKN